MTPQMHVELQVLCGRFYAEGISDEEWGLLQVHMAFCNHCHGTFVQLQRAISMANKSEIEPQGILEST